MKELTTQAKTRYFSLIETLCNDAITKIKGISTNRNASSHIDRKKANNQSIEVFFDNDTVVINLYLSVNFGVSIPFTASQLQETIIYDVEKATNLTVKNVNVHITDINL